MGANWDPFDPVSHRTMFYERIQQGERTIFKFLPFYQVNYPGLHGRAFEPVDCMKQVQNGGAAANSSMYAKKEINEVREFDWKGKIFCCENRPDGQDLTLHSYWSFDWPG